MAGATGGERSDTVDQPVRGCSAGCIGLSGLGHVPQRGRRHRGVMEAAVGFNGKVVNNTTPRRASRTFPNQKPWVDKSMRVALRSCTSAYNSGFIMGNMKQNIRLLPTESAEL